MRAAWRIGTVVVVAGVAGVASGDVVLYSQPVEPSNLNLGFGFFSSSQARARRNFKHADDFVLGQVSEVRSVRWWGMNEGLVSTGLANYDRFTIEFFASAPGPGGALVGTLIHAESFATGLTNPTPTGRVNPANGEAEIVQEVSLGTPVTLAAGTQYWLAVSARALNGGGDAWLWRDGVFVNGYSNTLSYATGVWSPFQDVDSGFELIGVPGAGTGAVLGTAVVVAPRRKRASRRFES